MSTVVPVDPPEMTPSVAGSSATPAVTARSVALNFSDPLANTWMLDAGDVVRHRDLRERARHELGGLGGGAARCPTSPNAAMARIPTASVSIRSYEIAKLHVGEPLPSIRSEARAIDAGRDHPGSRR